MEQEQVNQDQEYCFPYHYIPEFRDSFSQSYTWSWGHNYISAIEFILNKINYDKSSIQSIADIGCGDGRLTKELAISFPSKNVVGVDYSSKAISLAKALNPNVTFLNLDIVNDNIDTKYDAITLVEVFEHIPLELCHDFVEALKRLLHDDGVIYLTVPHINKVLSYKHFQHFSFESIKSYFEKDFIIEDTVFFDKRSRILSLIKKVMSNNLYVISNRFINNLFFKIYKKYYFITNSKKCGRIFLKLRIK